MTNISESLHERGLAIGWLNMETQEATFRFREERYTVPASVFWSIMHYEEIFPCASIDVLRRITKQ